MKPLFSIAVVGVMRQIGLLLILTFPVSFVLKAQLNNSYSISDDHEFDRVKFSLNATNGQGSIEPSQEEFVLDIHSNTEESSKPLYEETIVNRTKEVKVAFDEEESNSLSSSISKHMFSTQSVDDYTWKIYLTKLKPLDLDLNYAVGDTYIDLSDLPVEKLKMRTGSANVKVNYKKGKGNLLEMDTFLIKVDLGTFEARNLHLCNSKNIITDVGFGKVKIDFEDAEHINTNVNATVGAGSLEVSLPHDDISVRINVNDSPLCHIKMPKNFEKIEENVFASPGYDGELTNCINFSIDVAVGNIVFK